MHHHLIIHYLPHMNITHIRYAIVRNVMSHENCSIFAKKFLEKILWDISINHYCYEFMYHFGYLLCDFVVVISNICNDIFCSLLCLIYIYIKLLVNISVLVWLLFLSFIFIFVFVFLTEGFHLHFLFINWVDFSFSDHVKFLIIDHVCNKV